MPTDKPEGWDELEDGTREDAQISQEAERHYFTADGKRYWFDLKELSWKRRNQLISQNIEVTEEGSELKMDAYYMDALEEKIVDMSVEGGENVRLFLAGVGPELGDKLEAEAPAPMREMTEAEEGNSDGQSEEEEESGTEPQGATETPA